MFDVLMNLRKRVRTGLIERTEIRTLVLPNAVMDEFRADVKQREADGLPWRSEDDLLELWIVAKKMEERQYGLPDDLYPFPKRGLGARGGA
jgi:hypothetical protein